MKIAILTMPLCVNYGGILQAYALQQVLKKIGHDSTIVNRVESDNLPFSQLWRVILGRVKNRVLHQGGPILRYPSEKHYAKARIHVDEFIRQNMNVSPRLYSNNDMKEYIDKYRWDAFIVGSDQIWRPKYVPDIYNYFLTFVYNENIVKLAYAPSFGVDTWEFTEEQTVRCKELISKFKGVSVREKSGVQLCSDFLGRNDTIHVLDPTMLLSREEYVKVVEDAKEQICAGTLFYYILDENNENQEAINKLSQRLSANPFTIAANKQYDTCNSNIEDYAKPAITKWLRAFMDAEYIVTDSFHGCVFSIIFNKPFVTIGNVSRGLSRFDSLLSIFGLQERLITDISQAEMVLKIPIDWDSVNAIREEWKQKSIDFINKSLINE